jgi:hypothetical protein
MQVTEQDMLQNVPTLECVDGKGAVVAEFLFQDVAGYHTEDPI